MGTRTTSIIAAGVIATAALAAAACSSASKAAPAAATSPASTAAAPATTAPPPSGYPQQAADMALCSQYNSDTSSGNFQALTQDVAQAGSVSPVLAHDILTVVNNAGSVSQDEKNMVYVIMDCALVQVGKQPVTELDK